MSKHLTIHESLLSFNIAKNILIKPHVSLIRNPRKIEYIHKSICAAVITCNNSAIYDESSHAAENIVVTLNGVILKNNLDYYIDSNDGWINAGNYNFYIIGINEYRGRVKIIFKINKVTPTVTAPTAKNLTYNGSVQALVNAGSTDWGTLQYSLDNITYSTNIPEATNAGDYIVYYKVEGDNNVNDVSPQSVNVSIAKVTPTVVSPTAKVLTYNGSAQELVNAGSTDFGTLQYKVGSDSWSTSIPTRTRGDSYELSYRVVGDSNINDITIQTVQCSINEKEVTATVTLSQATYTYDGNAKEPIVTVSDGGTVISPSEYTVTYSNNTNAGTGTVTISDNVGGDYNVIGSATFTINKAAGSVTTAPTAKSLTYNGSAQALVNAGSGTGTMMYKLDNGSWGTSIPTATNATSYTVYYKAAESTNYNESASGSVPCSIGKADQSAPTATGATTTYNTTATATASGGGGQGSLEWYNGNTQTSVGSKTTKARWSGNSNYNASPYSNEVTITMNKAAGSVTTAPVNTNYTYNGTARAVASAGSGTGTMYYRLGTSGSFSTTMPTMTNAGSNTLYYYAAESTNYNQSSTGSITVSIQKASRTLSWTSAPSITYSGNTITVAAIPSAGSGDGSITYSSSNSNVASVNGSTISGRSVGSCTITATISQGTNYNAASTSYTLTVNEPYVGHAYVDLGLPSGTKWATINIGASSETSYGNYYQYGKGASQYAETSGQSDYSGAEDPLNSSVDTARQVWGGGWHMPTKTQFDELIANTTYEFITTNGINAGKFTAQNGNYVLLPAAGDYAIGEGYTSTPGTVNSFGYYWSSTPYDSDNAYGTNNAQAYGFVFYKINNSVSKYINNSKRKDGYSIRPVVG